MPKPMFIILYYLVWCHKKMNYILQKTEVRAYVHKSCQLFVLDVLFRIIHWGSTDII